MELKVKILQRILIIIGIVLCLVIISLYAICWFIVRDLYSWFFFLYPIIFVFAILSIAVALFLMTK
jgi:membrane protein YdbS with pleckstrin-like domain